MRVLIIGGNRFFGRRLAQMLAKEGSYVTILNRGQREDELGDSVERIKLDRKLLTWNHPAIAGKKWDIIFDHVCYDANEALSACQAFEGKTHRYVFISSQATYAPGADIRESTFDPNTYKYEREVDRQKDYGEAKRQSEAIFFQKGSFAMTAVRFPIVLGPDDYTERLKMHVLWAKNQKAICFPSPKAKISFVHAADAAKFLHFIAHGRDLGPINCCSQVPITILDLVKQIEAGTGKKIELSDTSGQGQDSPFGIESDWWMNTEKLGQAGFRASPITDWLPSLIKEYHSQQLN